MNIESDNRGKKKRAERRGHSSNGNLFASNETIIKSAFFLYVWRELHRNKQKKKRKCMRFRFCSFG